uniref:Uncharacterized protein n=1 Tax=Tetranychus urticae TaxID=32264 RepID=T1K8C6_TETUR
MCGSTLTSLSSQPISSVKLFKNFIFIDQKLESTLTLKHFFDEKFPRFK